MGFNSGFKGLTWSVQVKSFHFHLLPSILIRHLFTVPECRRNSHSLEGATESLLTFNTKLLNQFHCKQLFSVYTALKAQRTV